MLKTETINQYDKSSQFVDIDGARMHYLEEGEGDPILFLHGIPTSSYLWRNISSQLSLYGRCICLDLIGMGKSDKPDIEYTIFDHVKYVTSFIRALDLTNLTIIMHAWGSVIGFDYAMRHPANIKGLAFMEAHLRPVIKKDMIALPMQERSSILDADDGGYDVIMNSNYYVNKVMPAGVMRKLTDEELDHYQEPFKLPGSAKPIWQYLQDLPTGTQRTPVVELIENYSNALQQSEIPKLLLYAMPGFNTCIETVMWARKHLPNLEIVEIDDALHYAQESHPEEVGKALVDWYQTINDR